MLIGSFQIKVRRPRGIRVAFQHSRVTDTGVEPDVKNIIFPVKIFTTAGAPGPWWKKLSGVQFEPEIGSLLLHQPNDAIKQLF